MQHVVLIFPGLLSTPGEASVARGNLPGLIQFAEHGVLTKLAPVPGDNSVGTKKGAVARVLPEAAWLGMDPRSVVLQDGPLIVSALEADPPPKSVHFHLSLMCFSQGRAEAISERIAPEDLRTVLSASTKLNTKRLTIVDGEQTDHGLVWEEGSVDLGTVAPATVAGEEIMPWMPEGDGERLLRRFIDDSINLLGELELNKRREDEGRGTLNLLWPWGQGFREPLPNLAIRRGEIVQVESVSLRLQGLTRLVGYRHGTRASIGSELKVNWEHILSRVLSGNSSIVLFSQFSSFRMHERYEEMEWLLKQCDQKLLQPLDAKAKQQPMSISIIAPGMDTNVGLGLTFKSDALNSNIYPFDERSLDERAVPTTDAWRAVNDALG